MFLVSELPPDTEGMNLRRWPSIPANFAFGTHSLKPSREDQLIRTFSFGAPRLLLFAFLVPVILIAMLACGSAEEEPSQPEAPAPAAPAPTAAPAPAQPAQAAAQPAPAATAVPAQPAAKPKPTEAMMESPFSDGRRGGHMRMATGVWFDRWDMTTRSHWSSTQGLNRMYSGVLQFSPRDGLNRNSRPGQFLEVSGRPGQRYAQLPRERHMARRRAVHG